MKSGKIQVQPLIQILLHHAVQLSGQSSIYNSRNRSYDMMFYNRPAEPVCSGADPREISPRAQAVEVHRRLQPGGLILVRSNLQAQEPAQLLDQRQSPLGLLAMAIGSNDGVSVAD